MMRRDLREALAVMLDSPPEAYAFLRGSEKYPAINGKIFFYQLWGGTLVVADVCGLPTGEFLTELPAEKERNRGNTVCHKHIFGFHIHEGAQCTGNENDPFADAKGHFNPSDCDHPNHAGDLPPLFGAGGYALSIFYTDRFYPEEVVGRTAIVHDMVDDFHTQPSGNAGNRIACGEIKENKM